MTDLSWLTARPIAHRGYHDMNAQVWENTLPAFQRAVQANYAIECDVHLTADGEVIVFHDDTLSRLTGTEGYIWQRTGAEMQALTIGTTESHPPLLSELLELVAGRVPLVIELKGTAGRDDGLVAKVATALRRYEGKAAIMSFDHWLIRQFPVDAAGIPAGLTAWGELDFHLEAHFAMLGYVDFVSYGVVHLPNRFATYVRERLGMPIITWTVRDEQQVAATVAHGDQMTFEGFVA